MNRNLTLSQRIHNCAATQEVEFCHATHTYFHSKANSLEEWSRIWSKGNPDKTKFDTSSWAHAFGRMRGWRSVWHGSVTLYDGKAFERWLSLFEVMPEIGGLDPRPLMEISMHTLATDIVEVADDGLSARATFLTPGNIGGAENIVTPKNLGFGAHQTAEQDYQVMKDRVLEAVRKTFKPEFLNRIDEIIVFHPLDKANMKEIVNIVYNTRPTVMQSPQDNPLKDLYTAYADFGVGWGDARQIIFGDAS